MCRACRRPYISVGGLDLFLEENMTYADRLSRAGVPVEFHMYPRAYHGFYRAANARVTKQAERFGARFLSSAWNKQQSEHSVQLRWLLLPRARAHYSWKALQWRKWLSTTFPFGGLCKSDVIARLASGASREERARHVDPSEDLGRSKKMGVPQRLQNLLEVPVSTFSNRVSVASPFSTRNSAFPGADIGRIGGAVGVAGGSRMIVPSPERGKASAITTSPQTQRPSTSVRSTDFLAFLAAFFG